MLTQTGRSEFMRLAIWGVVIGIVVVSPLVLTPLGLVLTHLVGGADYVLRLLVGEDRPTLVPVVVAYAGYVALVLAVIRVIARRVSRS